MLFDRDLLVAALTDLAGELADAGFSAQIRVVGGAAIEIQYPRHSRTQDIDALYASRVEVREAVERIASERNWPKNWLNDDVKMYASHFHDMAGWVEFYRRGGVVVKLAPADLLLAMKLYAGRGLRDASDIDTLLDLCEVGSMAQAQAIFETYYPREIVAPDAQRQLEARFSSSS